MMIALILKCLVAVINPLTSAFTGPLYSKSFQAFSQYAEIFSVAVVVESHIQCTFVIEFVEFASHGVRIWKARVWLECSLALKGRRHPLPAYSRRVRLSVSASVFARVYSPDHHDDFYQGS